MALRKGDAMIQFFALLPQMREMYEKKGIVVAKRMYEILLEEGKITMGYKNFAGLFRKNLTPKKEEKSDFLHQKREVTKPQNNVEDLAVPDILKLIDEGKIPNEEITKLIDSGKIEDWDLPKSHELYMPKRRKITTAKAYVHDAGVPDSTRRI